MGSTADNPDILVVVGVDDLTTIEHHSGKAKLSGSTDFGTFLMPGEYHRLHVRPDMLRSGQIPVVDGYRHIVNFITEAETNRKVLDTLRKVVRGSKAHIVNPPEAVLRSTRDRIARRMAGIDNLVVPRVHRFRIHRPEQAVRAIEQAKLAYPLIIRSPGTHTGIVVGKFDSAAAVAEAMIEPGEYLATEFVDFRSGDGIYRKMRVYCIGDRKVFRHLVSSDRWNIHYKERDRFHGLHPSLIAEEAALFERSHGVLPDTVHDLIDCIRERMGLDYFGIDFAILPDGRMLLFEANATMTFFASFQDPRFPYLVRCVKPAGDAFRALLDLPPLPTAPIEGRK